MKKIVNFILVLALGAGLSYVFHDVIDTKLKQRFGHTVVDSTRNTAQIKLKEGAEKTYNVGKAAYEGGKEAVKVETGVSSVK